MQLHASVPTKVVGYRHTHAHAAHISTKMQTTKRTADLDDLHEVCKSAASAKCATIGKPNWEEVVTSSSDVPQFSAQI